MPGLASYLHMKSHQRFIRTPRCYFLTANQLKNFDLRLFHMLNWDVNDNPTNTGVIMSIETSANAALTNAMHQALTRIHANIHNALAMLAESERRGLVSSATAKAKRRELKNLRAGLTPAR
jgi:hypothetical protein